MSSNEKAKITVFIPVYNGGKFIERAVESVLAQTCCLFRLVIADNCSTDNTREIVSKYLSDERVVLINRHENLGMIGNFNKCLEDLQTEYYMVLSHDDYLFNRKALQLGLDVLEKNQNVPAVYSETMLVDTSGRQIMKRAFGFSGEVVSDVIAKKAIITGRNMFGVAVLIRTDAIKSVRYTERLVNTADIDFSLALGKGKKVYYVPEPLIAIRFHATNETHRTFNSLKKEFLEIAEKHKIHLSFFDRVIMSINDVFVRFQKKLFFCYLDTIRK